MWIAGPILRPAELSCLLQEFRQSPYMIGDARFHRRRHAQGLVNPNEVVPSEVQAIRRPQILPGGYLLESGSHHM